MPQDDWFYKTPHWLVLRQRVFARDDWRCVLCDSPENIECHHRTYARKGKEELRDCYTLCEPCHDVVTDYQRRLRYATRELPPVQEVAIPQAVPVFGSSFQEISFETNREISLDWRGASLDAQWPTERSAQRMDESQEENHGQEKEAGSRSRRGQPP